MLYIKLKTPNFQYIIKIYTYTKQTFAYHIYKGEIMRIDEIRPNLRRINLLQFEKGQVTEQRKLYNNYFLYVHKGNGVIEINGNYYNAIAGDMFYIDPSVSNTIIGDKETPFLLSGIDFDFTQNHVDNQLIYPISANTFNKDLVTEYISLSDFDGFPPVMNTLDNNKISNHIMDMVSIYTVARKYWNQYCNAILQALIFELVCKVNNPYNLQQKKTTNEQIIEYVTQNYKGDITNKSIADHFHYNEEYISRLINNYTGYTLKQYIIDLRMRHALDLIVNSTLSISEISILVGYDNVAYFSRIFKQKIGCCASVLRPNSKFIYKN